MQVFLSSKSIVTIKANVMPATLHLEMAVKEESQIKRVLTQPKKGSKNAHQM